MSTRKVLLVGYSEGGRLGMHYRSMFPSGVHALITLSTCPRKNLSPAFELSVFGMWQKSKMLAASLCKFTERPSDRTYDSAVVILLSPPV